MYSPIDYSKWDFSGTGKNLELKPLELSLWNQALPLQDKRDDRGHAESVTYFALELLRHISAERKVVIPACILHDTGYRVSPEEFRRIFVEKDKRAERLIRLEHQVIGASNAYELMREAGYSPGHVAEVMRIILDHDTRILPTTSNGEIVQDADILWRFTLPHLRHFPEILGTTPEENINFMQGQLNNPGFNFALSREIARAEMINTLKSGYS